MATTTSSWFLPAACQVDAARERSRGQQDSASWFSPTYQVNAANVALLPSQSSLHTPYFPQNCLPLNQAGVPVTSQANEQQRNPTTVDFSIRVINPQRKRDSKTFILKDVQLLGFGTVKSLREEILEQLGKSIVSFELNFDVGYMTGNQRICFREKDEIGSQLVKLAKSGGQLWCEGLCPRALKYRKRSTGSTSIVIEDSASSDDDARPAKAQKTLMPKKSAMDDKAERVQKLTDKLQGKHGDTYNKIQYKLWAEAMDVKRHDSMERPPPGTIWGGTPKQTTKARSASETMSEAFTNMATSLASAFGKSGTPPSSPVADRNRSVATEVGVSPGRLADLQGKFFGQLEQLHKLLERGALSEEQFEKRKQVILDRLYELAAK